MNGVSLWWLSPKAQMLLFFVVVVVVVCFLFFCIRIVTGLTFEALFYSKIVSEPILVVLNN